MRPAEPYHGSVLLLETSEELLSTTGVVRVVRDLGQRGILAEAAALVLARPPAQGLRVAVGDAGVERHGLARREAVPRVVEVHHSGLPTVMEVEAGHTDPQAILPYGGEVTVDRARERPCAHHG